MQTSCFFKAQAAIWTPCLRINPSINLRSLIFLAPLMRQKQSTNQKSPQAEPCFKYLQIFSHLGMVLETHMITCGVKKPKKQRHFFGFRAANFCQELTGSASIIHSSQKHGGFPSHGESPIAGLLIVEHPKTKWRIWGCTPPFYFSIFVKTLVAGWYPKS